MHSKLAAKAAFATAMLLAAASGAQADFWSDAGAPYKGTTIRGVSESTPPSNYVKDVIAPAFTKATGINVEFEATSWDQMYDKAIKDMEANTGIYDFVYIEQDIIYSYLSRDFLVDITQSLKDNPKLASPDFKVDDFTSFIDYFKGANGDIYGVPMEAFVKVYLYRKDLFGDAKAQEAFKAKYGYDLAPATTHKQYQEIAEFFTQWGKDNGHGAVGHHRPGPLRPSVVLVRVLRELGPDLRRLQLGHHRRQELRRVGRQWRLDEWPGSQGRARILARSPEIRPAGIDPEHLGRGRRDLRRRPRRPGSGLCRERRLDRDQCRQEQGRRQCRHHPAAARRRRDGGRRSRHRLYRLLRRRRLRHSAFVQEQGCGGALPAVCRPALGPAGLGDRRAARHQHVDL